MASPVHRWTDEHGPDELYDKFIVLKPKDVERGRCGSCFEDEDRIGADGEFIFVLRPERDREAWAALATYASVVEQRSPRLAAQLTRRLEQIALKEGA